jgi:hypothetical protein
MKKILLLGGTALTLGACAGAEQGVPLVFARTQTVGVSITGSVPDQGAHLTLGFSDRNIAIVPTTTSRGVAIRGIARDPVNPRADFQDSLSVLGQFEVSAKAADVSAGLGTFFSTGMASRTLSEGFRDKLRGHLPVGRPANPPAANPPAPAPNPPAPAPEDTSPQD